MTKIEFFYLLPYLLSFTLSTGITIYAWRHRRVQGAGAYAILSSAQTLSILGFIFELFAPDLNGKMAWDKVQWVTFALEAFAIPYFAIQYTEYKKPLPKLFLFATSIVPIGVAIFVMMDPWIHFIYSNPSLSHEFVFGELTYRFTSFAYFFAAYGYLCTLFAIILLARRFFRPNRFYRSQIMTVIIGLLFPVLGTALPLIGIQLTQLRDASPFTTAIGNIIVAWGIFRYRWLNIVHIARDKIIENMGDMVLVLDAQDRIIDINPSALQILENKASEMIGKSAAPFFAKWPEIMEKFRIPMNGNAEIVIRRESGYRHFDIKSTLLFDQRSRYQGRVFSARDITPYAALQWELRELNDELERRVKTRTEELAEAYDTTLEGWARALELRDKETLGHCWRVTDMTMKLALAMDIPLDEMEHIRRGAILHDIGKMAIPDEILRKTGPLTAQERLIVIQHPAIAYELLSRIRFLEKALDIPYCHHEKWDGSGYPRGLRGDEIPLAARIFSVVDVWDAVQSERPYKKGWTREEAVAYMQEQRGIYFDPMIVDVFLALAKEGKV
jgi:putative nucleotidyltransferase with HDIG domain